MDTVLWSNCGGVLSFSFIRCTRTFEWFDICPICALDVPYAYKACITGRASRMVDRLKGKKMQNADRDADPAECRPRLPAHEWTCPLLKDVRDRTGWYGVVQGGTIQLLAKDYRTCTPVTVRYCNQVTVHPDTWLTLRMQPCRPRAHLDQ